MTNWRCHDLIPADRTVHYRPHIDVPMNVVQKLKEIQASFGYLPRSVLGRLARDSGMPISVLHAVATSYPGFRPAPSKALIEIAVCRDMTCFRHGASEFHRCLITDLDHQIKTGKVAVEQVSCLGQCDHAREGMPVFTVDGVARWGVPDAECQRAVRCELIARLVQELRDEHR